MGNVVLWFVSIVFYLNSPSKKLTPCHILGCPVSNWPGVMIKHKHKKVKTIKLWKKMESGTVLQHPQCPSSLQMERAIDKERACSSFVALSLRCSFGSVFLLDSAGQIWYHRN